MKELPSRKTLGTKGEERGLDRQWAPRVLCAVFKCVDEWMHYLVMDKAMGYSSNGKSGIKNGVRPGTRPQATNIDL